MTGSLWAFLLISIFVIVTPGPDTAVTVRNTLLGGRIAGVATALGIALGQWTWALATSVGLVAVLLASEPIFNAIRWAGAAYLIWLGVQTLRSALTPVLGSSMATGIAREGPALRAPAAFRQGLLSDLGNPKMAVFFASVLPQFAPVLMGAALIGFGVRIAYEQR
jgi:threonine/homoserine/homoserine lactone efflux protein